MGELTTDSTPGGSTPAAAPTAESVAHDPRHQAIECAECFDQLQRNRDWRKARLELREWSGSSSPVTTYRRSSSSGTTWLASALGSSTSSPPLLELRDVGAAVRPVVRDVAGGRRAAPTHLVVKVLSHGAPHLEDARG
jgi:hypothetical protein